MSCPVLSPHLSSVPRLCGLSARVPTAPLLPSLWLPSEGVFSSCCPPLTSAQPTALGNGDTQTPFSVLHLDTRAPCTLRCCGLHPPVSSLSPCGAVGIKGQYESESELCRGLPADCRPEEERKRQREEMEAIRKTFPTEAGPKEPHFSAGSLTAWSCCLRLLTSTAHIPQSKEQTDHREYHGCHVWYEFCLAFHTGGTFLPSHGRNSVALPAANSLARLPPWEHTDSSIY